MIKDYRVLGKLQGAYYKSNKILIFVPVWEWYAKVVVDVNNLKNGKKPVKLQKESPAGCAGEGKQSIENLEKRKGRFKD